MLKFKNNVIEQVINAVATTGAKIDASPKTTQAVLNSMQLVKKFSTDIIVASSVNGLIISKGKEIDISNPVLFTDETLIEFSETITPDLYHKNNDASAEFRYYPALRQVLRVVNKSENDTILADDDHNIFRANSDIKYISAKQSVIPVFFPNLIKDRAHAEDLIATSNARRGMTGIKAGDKVRIRPYAEVAAEFGDEEITFGFNNETMRVAGTIKGASTIILTDHASHYGGKVCTVAKVLDERQEILLKTPLTQIINPVTGEELPNEMPIRFSKLHFVKV